jgi:hypothetical protein
MKLGFASAPSATLAAHSEIAFQLGLDAVTRKYAAKTAEARANGFDSVYVGL